MEIELKQITVRELAEGYEDNQEDGVVGYSGKLDIRPPYQREFIYKDKQRDAVIDTVVKGFPLNVMYWAVKEDGTFEIIDGQQRTISICQYVNNDFSFDFKYFDNLKDAEKENILNYQLMIYWCKGNDKERLDWFKTINIAGETLTEQELRNAVYSGSWVSNAKTYFSKRNCVAYNLANAYLSGDMIRQDYLEKAIYWINDGKVEAYMAKHQHDVNANELWLYFRNIIDWVKVTFPKYRKEMKGLDWGDYYKRFKDETLDTKKLEEEITQLMQDEDVTNKRGIYEYVLDRQERHLNIRAFDKRMQREAYERQKGICVKCGQHFDIEEMEADHITPWCEGGKTDKDNCQMLCRECNRRKSNK
jgi:hypothetical protein